jgi:tetratricopeptide (TPR) repeat protein
MKFITSFFSRLYQYATAFIVIGAPLFFIPKTGFTPDSTYYITMTMLVAIALVSYVITALLTRTWHSLSRLEFISYFAFSLAVLLSVVFAKNQRLTLFGEVFDQFSAVSLLSLPAIMYLVRTLPDTLRNKLKFVIVTLLSVSALIFVTALMHTGTVTGFTKQIFSGFANPISLSVYIGLFAVACLFFVFKGAVPKKHKVAIAITSLLFFAWAIALSTQDSVRPNFTSTMLVGKNVMLNEGVFGIGAGNFMRAWQLYRPESVIASPYFGYDFTQGSATVTTFFVTVGIVGVLAFLMLVLSALYSTIVSFRQNPSGKEHFILGLLSAVLVYFFVISWLVPISYSMLVVWMVVSGLGLAKARLSEYHPSKKIAFLMVPVACILLANMVLTINKVRAFAIYNTAQSVASTGDVGPYIEKAVSIYPYDGFYRVQTEYYIQKNRVLASTPAEDQEVFKNSYLENAKKAVDAGLAAVKLNPDNYQNYVSLGRSYELAVPFDKDAAFSNAKKSYEQAVKLYPENPYLYVMLARLEASAGTKEGVRVQLTEAIKKKNNFADALYLMSQLEASESKVDEAINYAIEAVKAAPNDPLVYIQAGLLFYGKRDYQNAVFALTEALKRDQNNANVAYFLALALRDGGRADLAKQIGEELLLRNPGNADLQAFLDSLTPKADPAPTPTKKSKK